MAVRNKQVEAKDSVGYLVRKDYVLTKRCTSPSVTAAVEDKAVRSVISGPRVATGPPVRGSPGRLDETARLPICARAFARCCFLRDILLYSTE